MQEIIMLHELTSRDGKKEFLFQALTSAISTRSSRKLALVMHIKDIYKVLDEIVLDVLLIPISYNINSNEFILLLTLIKAISNCHAHLLLQTY